MRADILGSVPEDGDRCRFRVWAPLASRVEVHLVAPEDRVERLEPEPRGYHAALLENVPVGARYFYRLTGTAGDAIAEYPDPASRCQPDGVHGASEVVSREFDWSDASWCGLPLEEVILYELHVGTFTRAGTLDAAVSHLEELRDLGVTAIELMPIAAFPGERNWGYDGVYPFAVHHGYGGPAALKRFVDACHAHGLAVVLDVVYNHFGPEGNHFAKFAPYFTSRYRTPWGEAVNFDGPGSDEVRRYFVDNALYWISEFHVDALRLDAVHAILDASAYTFLEELADAVGALRGRPRAWLMPESADNDVRLIKSRELGGYGLDAQWNDDFHHALRVLMTGERLGYYADFDTGLERMEKAFREGFIYTGQYSRYRRRAHGTSSAGLEAKRFIVFSQNHDQVGNRMRGDRLTDEVTFEQLKLAAAAVLLSPFLPLLFMGEEYGETAPFPYFVHHSETELIEAVRRGRLDELTAFGWSPTASEIPDPQDIVTFESARLNHGLKLDEPNRSLLRFYRTLIELRKNLPALRPSAERKVRSYDAEHALVVERFPRTRSGRVAVLFHFDQEPVARTLSLSPGTWRTVLDSTEQRFNGPGSAIPDRLDSDGTIEVSLPPWSAWILESALP